MIFAGPWSRVKSSDLSSFRTVQDSIPLVLGGLRAFFLCFLPLDYQFLCCSDCSIRWKHPFVTIPVRRAGWSASGFTHFQKGDSTGLSINSMSVTLRERPDWRLLFQMPVSSRSTFAVWSLSVSGSCALFLPSQTLTVSMHIFARRPYLEMFEDNLSESICSSQARTVSMVSSSTANTIFSLDYYSHQSCWVQTRWWHLE